MAGLLWIGAVAICLVAVVSGVLQYPPLALPLLYVAWRGWRYCRSLAVRVRQETAAQAAQRAAR